MDEGQAGPARFPCYRIMGEKAPLSTQSFRAYSVAMRWGEEGKPRKFPWKILALALLTLLVLYFIQR